MTEDSNERDIEIVEVYCPFCEDAHSYRVKVERPKIMLTRMSSYSKTFTRLFPCPKTGKKFEADFELIDNPCMKIESVEVVGPVEE